MEYYGKRRVVKSWISSIFLIGNSLYKSIIDYNLSRSKCGAPQGTVLGPKLFILLINDIFNVSDVVKFIIFAEDTKINILCPRDDI